MVTAPIVDDRSALCPLCGGANDCRLGQGGNPAEPCWCEKEKFSPALLAHLPKQRRGESCICARCVKAQ